MSSKDGVFSYQTLVHAVAGATVSGNCIIAYACKFTFRFLWFDFALVVMLWILRLFQTIGTFVTSVL
jgi:hypothetical protein